MPPLNPNQYQTGNWPYDLNVPVQPVRYDNSGRVNADLENLIDRSVGTGDILSEEFRQTGPAFWRNYNRYTDLGDQAYYDLMTGGAGYTPEEAAAIQDQQRLDSLYYSPDEYNNLFLTPDEQSAIAGNPWGVMDYYNPEAVRGRVNDFRDRGREAIDSGSSYMRNAIGNAQLDLDPAAAARMRGAASAYRNDANINEDALRLRPGFLDEYQMSDGDVRDLANLGARTASARWDSAYDDTARRAAAAGTMSPGAMAVLRGRTDRNSNIDAADAATNATLQGRSLQRQLLGQGEQMRLGSEQYITDANLTKAGRAADLALNAEQGIEDRRYRGQADRLNATLGTEGDIMNSRLGHETNVGNLGTGVEQYLNDTGTGLYQWGDTNSSNRNNSLATNRQGTTQAGQDNYRTYGFGASDRTRQGAQTVADTRLNQEQAGRDYFERQGQFSGGMYNDAANRFADSQIGITNAQLGGSADRRQRRGAGFWERFLLG